VGGDCPQKRTQELSWDMQIFRVVSALHRIVKTYQIVQLKGVEFIVAKSHLIKYTRKKQG
jgi:hypothetical protein